MRASELLGARVVTADGRSIGVVTGLRCSLDGAGDGPLPAPRLRTLVVGPRLLGASLGYRQEGQHGPWLVHRIVSLLHRTSRTVGWDDVAALGAGEIRLRDGVPGA